MKGIRALARHLDISIGTVSKALNGRFDINAETRERVLKAAAELGYVPNQSGRALRQGATRTVGFMIESNQASPTDSDNFFMAVFDGVQTVFRRHHLDLIVLPCASDEDPGEYLARIVARGLVDAVIISATRRNDPRVPLLEKAQVPFVALGRSSDVTHPWLELDFEGVAKRSVDRLVERGHRRIAVALPATELNLGNLFLRGYKKALRQHGIAFEPALAIKTESSEAGGHQLGAKLLQLEPRPTAVVLSYELPAVGLYQAFKDVGIVPGQDVAVIAFRESPITRHLVPRITSFTTSLRDLGVALGEMLLSTMPDFQNSYPDVQVQRIWPMELVPGESDPEGVLAGKTAIGAE
jgi:DNA-binding LacI/PurR family transcriptional regulator